MLSSMYTWGSAVLFLCVASADFATTQQDENIFFSAAVQDSRLPCLPPTPLSTDGPNGLLRHLDVLRRSDVSPLALTVFSKSLSPTRPLLLHSHDDWRLYFHGWVRLLAVCARYVANLHQRNPSWKRAAWWWFRRWRPGRYRWLNCTINHLDSGCNHASPIAATETTREQMLSVNSCLFNLVSPATTNITLTLCALHGPL